MYSMTVVDFPDGTTFRGRNGKGYIYATAYNNKFIMDGVEYQTLSAMAGKARNKRCSGWEYWYCRFPGGRDFVLCGNIKDTHGILIHKEHREDIKKREKIEKRKSGITLRGTFFPNGTELLFATKDAVNHIQVVGGELYLSRDNILCRSVVELATKLSRSKFVCCTWWRRLYYKNGNHEWVVLDSKRKRV